MTWNMKKAYSLVLLATTMSGCSAAPAIVRTGDRVELGFTCRLPDGELAATTRPDSAVSDDRKSPFYLPRNGPDTVMLTAGEQAAETKQERVSFEEEIMKRLGVSLVGVSEGEQTVLELQAERYPALTDKDRYVRMATVRKRQKELRLSREEYTTRTGKTPEVGQRMVLDPLVPGRISEVTDKEVVVLFAPDPGRPLTTPFGPVTLRETPGHYELIIAAEKDRLIRTGGMAGRISSVSSDSFEVDFGHPFGGEKLNCNVNVVSLKPAEKVAERPRHAAVAAPAGTLDPAAKKALDEGMARMLSGQAAGITEPAPPEGTTIERNGQIKAVSN